ncbi:MAG TPA: hypothetical protein VGD67_24630, partial [Pseudonocardiaceae bacterium]
EHHQATGGTDGTDGTGGTAVGEPPLRVPPLTDLRLRPDRPRQNLEPSAWLPPIRTRRGRPLLVVAAVVLVAATVLGGMALVADRVGGDEPEPAAQRTGQDGVSPRRSIPGLSARDATPPRVLFGAGDRADTALASGLGRNGAAMLTTVYASRENLDELLAWKDSVVPQAYAQGYALHLVIADRGTAATVDTPAGAACGRPYSLSPLLIEDLGRLATAFAGDVNGPPLLVTVFDSVQDYACTPGAYRANDATKRYYDALADQYLRARETVLRAAPNALVGLGWDSRVVSTNDPAIGGGRSMVLELRRLMEASEFTSVSAVRTDDNVADLRAAVAQLGAHAPVLVAYGPSGAAFAPDVAALLTPDSLADVTAKGLFAWTFASADVLDRFPPAYQLAAAAVTQHGRPAR